MAVARKLTRLNLRVVGEHEKEKPLSWNSIQGRWKKVAGATKEQWSGFPGSLLTGNKKSPSPERRQTDESLRKERQKTDQALADRQTTVEEDADMVVHRARQNADAVLHVARENADAVLSAAHDKADERLNRAVAEARVLEDQALRAERAGADESLRLERNGASAALAKLLPLEREKTDRYLLTERARSDDALSNRDDFLGIVTHDLRDLLGGIVTSSALLSTRAAEDDPGRQTLVETQRIERYAARMNRLIGDLLDVASIDAGKLAVRPVLGDWTALITEAADTFKAAASAKGLSLKTEMAEQPLCGEFDRDRMLQVLGNLISNSIKFTAQGGEIVLRGEHLGAELRFCVSDTGAGIPESSLDSIFERFWQVGRNERKGLGLGLYISRCIVEAHDGHIWAQSTHGSGSTLCFTLPAGAGIQDPRTTQD
jgi:signal transduction histidine kinase